MITSSLKICLTRLSRKRLRGLDLLLFHYFKKGEKNKRNCKTCKLFNRDFNTKLSQCLKTGEYFTNEEASKTYCSHYKK